MIGVKEYRNKLERLKGKKQNLENDIEQVKKEINIYSIKLKNVEDAKVIVQIVAKQTQEELQYHISEIVSLALSSVYDDPYKFILKFEMKRGKTEAIPLFEKNGFEYTPGKRTGYGSVDIAAFALRIAIWNLKKPKDRNVLILDEPFPSIDVKVQERVIELLHTLSEMQKIQIIMITHNERFIESNNNKYKDNKIFRVTQEQVEKWNVSKVVEI